MSWLDAEDELIDLLTSLGQPVLRVPPYGLDVRGLVILLQPSAREVVDRRGGVLRRTAYDQRIRVLHPLGDNPDIPADRVSDLVEDINDELDMSLKLAGYAVSVSPPEWGELVATQYPAGEGPLYAEMTGTIVITVDKQVTMGPGDRVASLAVGWSDDVDADVTELTDDARGRSIEIPTNAADDYLVLWVADARGDLSGVYIGAGGFNELSTFGDAADLEYDGRPGKVRVSHAISETPRLSAASNCG